MNEVDSNNDKEIEHRLKWWWISKWRMLRQIKKVIAFADYSVKTDVLFLADIIKEQKRQLEYIETAESDEKKVLHKMIYDKHCELERILNLIGFIDLSSIDISVLSEKLIADNNKWSRNLYARYAYMMMYELTEDILQLLGNDRKKDGKVLGVRSLVECVGDVQLTEKLKEVSGSWNNFWKKIGTSGRNFSQIRNISTAHRDHDFKKQYETIINVSWEKALNDVIEFSVKYTILRVFMRSFLQMYSVKYNEDVWPLMKIGSQ